MAKPIEEVISEIESRFADGIARTDDVPTLISAYRDMKGQRDDVAIFSAKAQLILEQRNTELTDALERLKTAATILQQNAVGCCADHHSVDFAEQGLPGWLKDTAVDIEIARATLTKQSDNEGDV